MKKYKVLYPPLADRIFAEESDKKDPVKAAKTRMHKLYGAYIQGNAHKKAAALLEGSPQENAEELLGLHASTKERLPYIAAFYELIAKHIGAAETIIDLGCGFNPFSIPLMPPNLAGNLRAYYAYDIDLRTKILLNRFLSLLGLPDKADCADLAAETPSEEADAAFLFKLLPVLEAQAPGRGFELARSLNARFLVITYPLKSLGGREKGMGRNYSKEFENALAGGALGRFTEIARERVGDELIYVLR